MKTFTNLEAIKAMWDEPGRVMVLANNLSYQYKSQDRWIYALCAGEWAIMKGHDIIVTDDRELHFHWLDEWEAEEKRKEEHTCIDCGKPISRIHIRCKACYDKCFPTLKPLYQCPECLGARSVYRKCTRCLDKGWVTE